MQDSFCLVSDCSFETKVAAQDSAGGSSFAPAVSLVILAYNQERFIADAVQGALSQDYPNLEIVVSDDCSFDETCSIVDEVLGRYSGKHKVIFNRNPANLGIASHLNRVWGIVSGELVVVQAGDDVSLPSRVSTIVEEWLKSEKRFDLITSDAELMDEKGNLLGRRMGITTSSATVEELLLRGKTVSAQGCVNAYSRRLLDQTPPLHPLVKYEDVAYLIRSLLHGGVLFVTQPLLLYRQHSGSVTAGITQPINSRHKEAEIRRETARLGMLLDAAQVLRENRSYGWHLRWKIFRQIGASQLMLSFLRANSRSRFLFGLAAIFTLRPRLLRRMCRGL